MAKYSKILHIFVALTFLLGILGTIATPPSHLQTKVQPQLLVAIQSNPQANLPVIVQKLNKGGSLETRVAAFGGKITKELSLINAFAAELPAWAALELAREANVRWVSLDAEVAHSSGPIDTTQLVSAFVKTVGADQVWNTAPGYLQGQGVTVAVVDSGNCQNGSTIDKTCNDLYGTNNQMRVLATVSFLGGQSSTEAPDHYGHGSLVEGIIGGSGRGSNGRYMGISPNVNLVNVRIADNLGMARSSDVVAGLEWVLENKDTYNIRVVNISLNSSTPESYHTNPMAAACEILWFNGIVVVVSAGNNGSAGLYPPANDPFVITVGATNDFGTPDLADDVLASYSAFGSDELGGNKPDLVAPGTNLVSIVPRVKNKIWKDHSSNRLEDYNSTEYYMRVSGTSFSAPVVSGAVALLLQDEPTLTPDQVKYRLMSTANRTWPGYSVTTAGAGYLDVYAAVNGTSTEAANTGFLPSNLLSTGSDPITWGSVGWNSVGWNSVGWNSVGWNSVGWNSVGWNSVGWNSDYWGP